jgi:hypothetical protein
MARKPKDAGDDGDWNLDAAAPVSMTIKQRCDTQLGVTSEAVREAMRQEEAFVNSVKGGFDTKRFTDRRPPPDRRRETP